MQSKKDLEVPSCASSSMRNRYELELQARLKARTKVSAENNPIKHIYLTTGEHKDEHSKAGLQKRAGLVIDGKIYWLEVGIEHIWELSNVLDSLGVSVSDDGEWGFWEGNRAPLINSITVLRHEEVFAKDSKYIIDAAYQNDGYPWWTVKAIKKLIFNPLEIETTKLSTALETEVRTGA